MYILSQTPWCDVCICHSFLFPSLKKFSLLAVQEREKTLFQCKYLHMRKSGLQWEEKRLEHWPGQNSSSADRHEGGTRTRFPTTGCPIVGTNGMVPYHTLLQGHICILRYHKIPLSTFCPGHFSRLSSLSLVVPFLPPPPYLPRIFIIIWHIFREKRGRP